MYMATGKQLRKAIKINDLTMETAAEKLGVSRQTIYNLVNKAELDEETVHNVKERLGVDLSEPVKPFLDQRREHKASDEPYMVTLIDIPAQAGYAKAYQQRDYIETLKKYPILPDVDPTGATWRYFQIEGDSMEPEIMSGDTILCSLVYKEDWQKVTNYHTHVIVTDDNLWIKDVYRETADTWIMLSQNVNTKPFTIKVRELRQVWVMRRHIKARAKKARMYDIEEIKKQLK